MTNSMIRDTGVMPLQNGQTYNTSRWLLKIVPTLEFITKAVTPKQIVFLIHVAWDCTVNDQAVKRVKEKLIHGRRVHQVAQYKLIPHYLQRLQNANLTTIIDLVPDIDGNNGNYNFQRLFICPGESAVSFKHMRRFLTVDGTFLKAKFMQTLLFAVGIDGNGKNLILAWGMVESENYASGHWFLTNLKRAMPGIDDKQQEGLTLISDGDKG